MDIFINTFGTSVSKENEYFVISNCEKVQKIPVKGIKSISLAKGVLISSDAIFLAVDKEIDVLFVDKSGDLKGRVWSNKYGSISSIRKGQLEFSLSNDAIPWIKEIISAKIDNQQALLLMFSGDDSFVNASIKKTINRLDDYKSKISSLMGDYIPEIAPSLRGWEALSSKEYFKSINTILPNDLKFKERSKHPAKDLFNCLLNYSYGMLYSKIEGALIKSGIDPYVGIFHRDDYNRPVLVYDIIELYRVWADYVVISISLQNAVTEEFYSIREDGSYWLESLGRRIVIQSFNDYLAEVIKISGVSRSRLEHIFLYCQALAQKFKKY